jgi:hypothetical protein
MSDLSALASSCSTDSLTSVYALRQAMEMQKALMAELMQGVSANSQNLNDTASISPEALALYKAAMGGG